MKINLKFFQIPLIAILFFCSSAIAQVNVEGNHIKIGDSLVAFWSDFPNKMNWEDATEACKALGAYQNKVWRLPTKDELNLLFKNKNILPLHDGYYYWSSTKENSANAWYQAFKDFTYEGVVAGFQGVSNLDAKMSFRAVMTVEQDVIVPAKIIGKSVRIGNLVVTEFDFPKTMYWDFGKAACAKLGKGWRLPTINELSLLYKYKKEIGGFKNYNYWSSDEYGGTSSGLGAGIPETLAQYQDFNKGDVSGVEKNYSTYGVRAVCDVISGVTYVRAVSATKPNVIVKNTTKTRNEKLIAATLYGTEGNNTKGAGGFSQKELLNLIIQAELGSFSSNSSNSSSKFSSPPFNAWQCVYCAVLSRSSKEPCCGEFGKCPARSSTNSHSFRKANTAKGFQCTKCGIQAFVIPYNTNDNGRPCCGEFGNCRNRGDHYWRAF